MLTELVRIGRSAPACRGGSAKYQTCFIFHRPPTTLCPDFDSTHLETVLSWISTACWLHFPVRLMNISRTKQGWIVYGRASPIVATCLSRCARPGLSRKTHISASSCNTNLDSPPTPTPKEMSERQNWIQDKFHFLKSHIKCRGVSKSSGFKSQA